MVKAIAGGELFVLVMIKIINNMNQKILYFLAAIILLVLVYYFLIPKYSFPIIPPHKAGPLRRPLMGDEISPIPLRCNIITGRCDEVDYSSEGRRWVPFVK